MPLYTADLCDAHPNEVQIAEPMLKPFGGNTHFHGEVHTVRVFEDNVIVKEALSEPGEGKVLVVDGSGSIRCALVGGNIAELAANNGWAGIIINGCVRDVHEIGSSAIGVLAIASCPKKSTKRGLGDRGYPVHFAGVDFHPGDYAYADADGLIVAGRDLES